MLLGATIHEFGAVMPIVDIEEMMENLGICAELAKLKAAGKDTERHRLMKIDADDPVVTKRLELLHTELKEHTCTVYLQSFFFIILLSLVYTYLE